MPATRKVLSLLIRMALPIMAMIGAVGCRPDNDSWERIQERGILRVGVDPTFPPFALAEGDTVDGIDIALAQALAGTMGLEAQFTYFGYDGLYDALTTDQVDVLISALVIMPERTKDIAYTDTYFDAGQFLFVPVASEIAGMADLSGRTLAVELGALGHVEALKWEGRLSDLEMNTFGSATEALEAVVMGGADAALIDRVSGLLFIHDQSGQDNQLAFLATPVLSEPYAMAVRIEDRILLKELNEALLDLKNAARLDEIIDQHLDP